jgi:hypothetical protein
MQWQYSLVPLDETARGRLQETLDAQGREGWELAAVIDEGGRKVGIFKRAVEAIARVS